MKTKPAFSKTSSIYSFSILQAGILVTVLALIVMPLFSSSSASSSKQAAPRQAATRHRSLVVEEVTTPQNQTVELIDFLAGSDRANSTFRRLMPLVVPQSTTGIETLDATCTTPKTTFVLGDTVCARATGLVGFRFAWVDPAGFNEKRTDITTDPQDDTFTLPTTQTSVINDTTVDNRGEWRVNVITSRSSLRTATFSTVKDPDNPAVDLSITKSLLGDNPQENGVVQYEVVVINNGPDDAVNTRFQDSTFSNATYSSVTQTEGPPFVCTGSGSADCSIALFPKGSKAKFLVNFTAGPAGGNLQNTASVTSDTTEQNSLDNSFTTASVKVGSGTPPPACELECPQNINAVADTEENGERGTHVSFAAPSSSGTCGAVTTSPTSGSFFPVGTTTVVASSEEGNGSCSFTITVTDTGNNPPTISCPANQTGTADANCAAAISVGTAAATGTNVTVIGTRSDGALLYTCDEFGNCTRNSSDTPFAVGTTTITWIAYTHDVAGPYDAQTGDEESHRTGSASCTQTMTVEDVTPPTINAPPQTASADANCMASVPDYSNTASDNCACSSSDTSEVCEDRGDIVVTQSIPAGTLLGPGTYTITLTANDGSSSNGGAGNSTTTTTTFTVQDTTAPVISCPSNVTQPTDPGTCSASVNPGTATATDNCDSSPTITATRSDGQPLNAPYPAGNTTITWRATDDAGNFSECSQTITVNAPAATALGPANFWVGVKNSDSVGLRMDFLTEIYRNGQLIGSGQLDDQAGGSSGFNNAILRTIAIVQSQSASFCPGDQLSIKLYVRAGPTGHVSGYARLWYDDAAADSRFAASLDGNTSTYYLLDGFVTGASAGPGPKKTIDVFVHRNQNGNAFQLFGTWVKTF